MTEENRSFFLNELDGFALNEGITTITTPNHPERLDSAISAPVALTANITFNCLT